MEQTQRYLQVMLNFARKAGRIATGPLGRSGAGFKADNSVITRADRTISRLGREALGGHLKDSAHLLIDEEDPRAADYLDQKRLERTRFLWAIDPIDGTRLYANGMPTFGVSIGLMKDLKPWLGVVYFPVLKELFFCDGKSAFFVHNPFGRAARRKRIIPVDERITGKSLFFCNDTFFRRFAWNDPAFHIMIHACAVVNLCWPAVGRGVGCFLRSFLWDFAGSWPIALAAGLDFRRVSDGRILESVHADLFALEPKPWELKEYYLVSSKRNYEIIKSKIIDRESLTRRQ
jgi:myo-inositol-1(or 4)-monophosphatase